MNDDPWKEGLVKCPGTSHLSQSSCLIKDDLEVSHCRTLSQTGTTKRKEGKGEIKERKEEKERRTFLRPLRHTQTHRYTVIQIHTHGDIQSHRHTHRYTYTDVQSHRYTHRQIYMQIHSHTHIDTQSYRYTHTDTFTPTYTHRYTITQTQHRHTPTEIHSFTDT